MASMSHNLFIKCKINVKDIEHLFHIVWFGIFLTHYGLVTSYGDKNVGQHLFR